MRDDLTLNQTAEVGRIMARDDTSKQEAIDRYFGAEEPVPDARTLPDGTHALIERRYDQEIEERSI